jgi:hypothetical protein
VSYVRAVCAQAGVGFQETSPDEDVLAVDGDVKFREASVGVQVKCTSTLKIGGRTASWPLEPGWVRKWAEARLPVYFILVIVEKDISKWIDHRGAGTLLRAAAFWKRITPAELSSSISIPKAQRFTADTLPIWRTELLSCFGEGGAE